MKEHGIGGESLSSVFLRHSPASAISEAIATTLLADNL